MVGDSPEVAARETTELRPRCAGQLVCEGPGPEAAPAASRPGRPQFPGGTARARGPHPRRCVLAPPHSGWPAGGSVPQPQPRPHPPAAPALRPGTPPARASGPIQLCGPRPEPFFPRATGPAGLPSLRARAPASLGGPGAGPEPCPWVSGTGPRDGAKAVAPVGPFVCAAPAPTVWGRPPGRRTTCWSRRSLPVATGAPPHRPAGRLMTPAGRALGEPECEVRSVRSGVFSELDAVKETPFPPMGRGSSGSWRCGVLSCVLPRGLTSAVRTAWHPLSLATRGGGSEAPEPELEPALEPAHVGPWTTDALANPVPSPLLLACERLLLAQCRPVPSRDLGRASVYPLAAAPGRERGPSAGSPDSLA